MQAYYDQLFESIDDRASRLPRWQAANVPKSLALMPFRGLPSVAANAEFRAECARRGYMVMDVPGHSKFRIWKR
jgi:hypothetical protein